MHVMLTASWTSCRACPTERLAAVARLCPACHVFKHGHVHAEVESGVAKKVFDLKLPELGPYNVAFTRSGRHMLLGGRKGHLALMDWQRMHSVCEVQVGDHPDVVLQNPDLICFSTSCQRSIKAEP